MTMDGFEWVIVGMIWIVSFAVIFADTPVGDAVLNNRVSQRWILPIWEQIKRPVHWVAERMSA